MNGTNKTLKYVCIGLGAVVVVLLIVLAFVLGRNSGMKNEPAAPTAGEPGAAVTETAADGTSAVSEKTTEKAEGRTDPAEEIPTAAQTPLTAGGDLQISMSAGTLTVTEGAAFDVQYDPAVIRVATDGDVTVIENLVRNPSASERRRMNVTVTVPETTSFGSVDIELGAGKMIVRSLRAETLDLELGAGSTVIDRLYVTGSAEIQEGAGELSVKGGEIANLTLQCGAGATRVAAALTGASRIDAAVGAVDLQFLGDEADYTVAFQMGLGACYYNNQKIARSGVYGEGPNRVDITGGFGVMRVNVG